MYVAILLLTLSGDGKDTAVAPSGKTDELTKWVSELNAKQFSDRQHATKQLFRAGQAAFPRLIEGAQDSRIRETVTRCIEILKRHYKEGNAATKQAAKLALQKVEGSDNKIASTRAHAILHPKPPTPARGIRRFGGRQIFIGRVAPQQRAIPARIVLPAGGRFGGIQIARQVGGGVVTRSVKVSTGNKTISINEDHKGVKIEVKEKDAKGKEKITKYEAKNAAELKTKHPEGYKIYSRYIRQPRIPRFGGNAIPQAPVPRIRPPMQPNPEFERLKKATRKLQRLGT